MKNETIEEFMHTLFHEFQHWHQYWIDNRQWDRIGRTFPDTRWDSDDAEEEAEIWELIGHNTFKMYNQLEQCYELQQKIKG